ncbi:MAG: A/G-specific adenine glycosylase, partial [Bacteroidales bacterium]|nr:A/G-specific adenine glycosylase [Bacteroidales bacterium]
LPPWAQAARLQRRDVRHQLTHRTRHADFYVLDTEERPPLPEAFRWVPEPELGSYAKPRLVSLLLETP